MFEFCLPTKSTSVPSGPDWLHEVKYDGYRLRLEAKAAAPVQRDVMPVKGAA